MKCQGTHEIERVSCCESERGVYLWFLAVQGRGVAGAALAVLALGSAWSRVAEEQTQIVPRLLGVRMPRHAHMNKGSLFHRFPFSCLLVRPLLRLYVWHAHLNCCCCARLAQAAFELPIHCEAMHWCLREVYALDEIELGVTPFLQLLPWTAPPRERGSSKLSGTGLHSTWGERVVLITTLVHTTQCAVVPGTLHMPVIPLKSATLCTQGWCHPKNFCRYAAGYSCATCKLHEASHMHRANNTRTSGAIFSDAIPLQAACSRHAAWQPGVRDSGTGGSNCL